VVKPSHEIKNGSINKMGFIKVHNTWINKEEDSTGTSVGPSGNAETDDGVGPNAYAEEDYTCMLL